LVYPTFSLQEALIFFHPTVFLCAHPSGDKEGARSLWLSHALFESVLASDATESFKKIVLDYSGWHWLNKNPVIPLKPTAIERLETIQAPTLVIVGEHDLPDFHAIADELTRRIPKAQKTILKDAGHMCPMEAPEIFNRVVIEFLCTCL
jgi:pimeloyl-ACP methyl ester carboxylesterase